MVIALLTDFGEKDGFVGAVKGVILSVNPRAIIVDITHQIEPFNILEGALVLKAHYRYFPENTVFLCVVDPGVGSERKPLAIRCGPYFFVGPDNGIFDLALKDLDEEPETVVIENDRFTLPKINNTFHGRDIFAPVSAYITKGVPLEEFGSKVKYTFRLDFPEPEELEEGLRGRIVYFDRFGNAVTNVPCGNYSKAIFRGKELRVVPYFRAGEKGDLCAVCGSFGFMELFLYMENARRKLELREGEEVWFLA